MTKDTFKEEGFQRIRYEISTGGTYALVIKYNKAKNQVKIQFDNNCLVFPANNTNDVRRAIDIAMDAIVNAMPED